MNFLTKSDFIAARSCPTKLYYRLQQYPSLLQEDEYLEYLRDGGFMVEGLARLLHPEGVEIPWDARPEVCFARTMEALRAAEDVTLFEATVIVGQKLARIDILRQRGSRLEVIEVKSRSIDSSRPGDPFRGSRGRITPEWRTYIEDVAYQVHILEELFPHTSIEPALCLVDKSRSTTVDSIFSCFSLSRPTDGNGAGRGHPTVQFTGDAEAIRKSHFLITVGVRAEVDEVMGDVAREAARFSANVVDATRIPPQIGVHCRRCEYRLTAPNTGGGQSGFAECWGPLASESPHILSYYNASQIGGRGTPLIDALVRRGRAALSDVQPDDLAKADGSIGPVAQRQLIQREYTLRNEEFFGVGLQRLGDHSYPLHCIDFETSRTAIPYAPGMHPYEQVCFQWSCHSQASPGAAWTHTEWINCTDPYPNVQFARSLMAQLGRGGTVYTWSAHERSALADILRQMTEYAVDDDSLRSWLLDATRDEAFDIIDLCAIARDSYFHPKMGEKLSVKAVLPAVWETNVSLHSDPLFSKYYARTSDGRLIDPYATLAPLPFTDGNADSEEVVANGVGAMRAFQEMCYGASRTDAVSRGKWRKLLLQYCELDTAAMVMIWSHWRQHAKKPREPRVSKELH